MRVKTSVNPDSWTECGVGQWDTHCYKTVEHGYTSLREGGRGQRESSALCFHLRNNIITMLFLFRRGCTGMGREIIDDKNKVGNLKSMKNIVILWWSGWKTSRLHATSTLTEHHLEVLYLIQFYGQLYLETLF